MKHLIAHYFNAVDRKALLMYSAAMLKHAQITAFLLAYKLSMVLLLACFSLSSSRMLFHTEFGQASWYGPGFQGLKTASGEIFDTNKLSAAHPTLPLGTRVIVTNLAKNKSVEVKIIDRGPYVSGRSIDLSRAAAKRLGMLKEGIAEVRIKVQTVNKKNL